jgi:type IV pilus assembly protein PilX
MKTRSPYVTRPCANRGAVLVVGLIFLALLMLIGVTAYSVATQEERMAGNARDRVRAFEAAEMALRNCEAFIATPLPPTFSDSGTVVAGMYKSRDVPPDVWETMNWSVDPARQLTGVAGVSEQPKCIVEKLADAAAVGTSQRAELPQPANTGYRVTARGVGANPGTQVVLQSFFIRN